MSRLSNRLTDILSDARRATGGLPEATRRADIRPGMKVSIVLKKDQRTGALTQGIVKDILTGSPVHTRGIKVRLESGEVGRVARIGD